MRRSVQLHCVRFEISVGCPDGDKGYVSWEFTRGLDWRYIDLGVIRVALEALDSAEIIQAECIDRILRDQGQILLRG